MCSFPLTFLCRSHSYPSRLFPRNGKGVAMPAMKMFPYFRLGSDIVASLPQQFAHVLQFIGRIRFMAGIEIKDLSASAMEHASAAEYFAALKPSDVHQFVRRRNVKRLAVHLFLRNIDRLHAPHDGMRRIDAPQPLSLAALAP